MLSRSQTSGHWPLTASQTSFWNSQKLWPDAPICNMIWRFDLFLDLDERAFAAAFQDVVGAHEIMRAVFFESGGVASQKVGDELLPFPDSLDLSDETDPERATRDFIQQWGALPFDLGQCSYRSQLIKLGPQHWVWCLAQHHIACDAQSGVVLFDAVSERYLAALDGCCDTAITAPSYFDKVEAWTANPPEAKQGGSGRGATTNIRKPYGGSNSYNAHSERVAVPQSEELKDAVDRFVKAPENRLFTHDLSLFATYLTAFAAFLYRTTGNERIVIGVPSHNRLSDADKSTAGLFMEVLPLELTIAPEDTFRDLLANVKAAIGDFLRSARPNAILTKSDPDISAILNFIQARFGDFAGAPARIEYCHSGAHDSAHSLRLQVIDFEGSGHSNLFLDINDDLLKVNSADLIASHFTSILRACVETVDQAVPAVDMCSEAERHDIAAMSSDITTRAAAPLTVLDRIRDTVAKQPDKTAIVCGNDELSYRELALRSSKIAAQLIAEGITAGDSVAVCMRRSPELAIALIGVLKAGACFVPIASNVSSERCSEIVDLARASVAIVDDSGEANLANAKVKCLRPDVLDSGADHSLSVIRPDDPAYVLFTSGSTGVPKGVVVDHMELSKYIDWARVEFGGAGAADYALFSSISFDLTITSIFSPFVSGGRVVIYPERSDPDLAVLDVFSDDAVDVVKLTPSHLALVCEAKRPVSNIRTLVMGGENLTKNLCLQARSILSPDLTILNEYGPTEAVVGCMVHRFDDMGNPGASVPIGKPAHGVEITVRDSALNLVPIGVVGEICIGGRLSKGYFERDDLTAQSFVFDPLSLDRKIYKTGDLGRLRPDGIFEYFGRSDQQLKIKGVRIETAEIEAAITAVPGVQVAYIHNEQPAAAHSGAPQTCARCGIPDNYPGISFSKDGTCHICTEFEVLSERAQAYFPPSSVLVEKLDEAAQKSRGAYDVIMLLSGGKDSTYAAYRLAEQGRRVLALTLDNGFLSEGAMTNVREVTDSLGWDHRFLRTSAMNEIFVDSLKTFSNVCQGCFKTIYTLALRVARDEGVPAIVTGLSRGQFFETRLSPDLFVSGNPTSDQLDGMVLQARKRYHGKQDAVSKLLNTRDIIEDGLLDKIEFIDLYRYIDVPVSEIYRYLSENSPWRRPDDTGRSTNCKINDAGIFVHKKLEGFHNYALPYSWDVRMGHKTRDQALHELNDEIDVENVRKILDEIGFDERLEQTENRTRIIAYAAVAAGTTEAEIWAEINANLARDLRPDYLVLVDQLPLTSNGKVDTKKLPIPTKNHRTSTGAPVAPRNEREQEIAGLFKEILGGTYIGVLDDFFDLGGDSLAAIKIAMLANEVGIPLPPTALFIYPTVAKLAVQFPETAELPVQSLPDEDDQDLLGLDDADLASIARALK